MIFGYFTLFVALIIEIVGAYYSITGLAAIFSGAVIPILIMGGSLEVGKVTAAVWLKNNWHRAGVQYKMYLLPAVALLMVITSMGIFGFLSKAHNDQNLVSGDVQSKIAIYDEKIKIQRDNIESARRALQQIDAAVDQTMSRSNDEKGADKATAIRRSQARERSNLQNEIARAQGEIVKLNDLRAPIAAEVRKVEAEVGPIKYIAKFVYGDNPDANILEKAVVWVIIMIVAVFDPLALVLILAAQQSIRWAKGEDAPAQTRTIKLPAFLQRLRDRFKKPVPKVEVTPEPEEVPVFDRQEPEFYTVDVTGEPFVEPKEELLEEKPAEVIEETEPEEEHPFRGKGIQPGMPMTASYNQPKVEASNDNDFEDQVLEDLVINEDIKSPEVDLGDFVPSEKPEPEPFIPAPVPFSGKMYKFATDPVTGMPDYSKPLEVKDITEEEFKAFNAAMATPVPEPVVEEPEVVEEIVKEEPVVEEPVVEAPVEAPPVNLEAAPGRNRGVMTSLAAQADNAESLGKASNTGFGNEFPANPERGDLYLRTDYLPNRLYKFNEYKWIEVDKNATDVYAYNEMYIKHLIDQIDSGNYDIETLSDVEREQISQYLERNAQ
jgi:hypothetical protein